MIMRTRIVAASLLAPMLFAVSFTALAQAQVQAEEAVDWPHNGSNAGSTPVRILVVTMGADGALNSAPVPR